MIGLRKIRISTILELFIIWLLFQSVISSSLLRYSNYDSVLILFRYVTIGVRFALIVLGLYCFSRERVRRNTLIPLVLYIIVVLITTIYNKSFDFFDALFVAFVFRNKLSRERIIRIFFWTILISCMFVILAYCAGAFPYYVVRRTDGRERMHLGFVHPNSLGYYVMTISFIWVLKIKDKIKLIHVAILILVSLFLYIYPNSFSSAISLLLFAVYLLTNNVYSFLFKNDVIKNVLVRYSVIVLVPIIVIVIYWLVTNVANASLASETLYTFFARFRLGSQAIQKYGIHLFGSRDIQFVGTATRYFENSGLRYFTVDCFYIQVLVKYGIVPTLFFLSYYIACLRACIKVYDSRLLGIFVILAVYSINEAMILSVTSSFLYIIASAYLWDRGNITSSTKTGQRHNTWFVIKRI